MRALVAAVLLGVSSAALAEGGGEASAYVGPRADYLALDRNRDGSVSKIEALGNPEVYKRFAAFDVNHDGLLSEAEYARVMDDNHRRVLTDAAITARVKAALLAERGIPSLAISVETYEGRVQLSGFVRAPELASRAGRVAAGVSGVRTVHNNLSVK